MAEDPWPFDQERRCAVVTLRSIVFDGEPILLVFHDEDDHGWQFLDGQAFEMSNAALVALEEIVKRDASVLEIADRLEGVARVGVESLAKSTGEWWITSRCSGPGGRRGPCDWEIGRPPAAAAQR
jgi:hypothetical protein